MSRLRVYARIARVLMVVTLGLGMASVFGVFERLGLAHSMARRQRWSRFFMARLGNALPFDVTVHGELPKTPMLWVSNHVSWTCLLYTSPSPRDRTRSRMPSSA